MERRFPGAPVFLLVLVDMQKQAGLVKVENTSKHLLYYCVHEDLWLHSSADILEQRHRNADTHAAGIGAALRYWNQTVFRHGSIATEPVRSLKDIAQLEARLV